LFELFTDRARKIMQLANQEAQRFNHEYIGTEHILLGLVKEGSGVAANALTKLGIDLRRVRLEVEKLLSTGPGVTSGKLPQTPRAKRVIEYSMEEARNLHHNYVGSEHLLLGLLREQACVAARVLIDRFGVTLEQARSEIQNLLGSPLPETAVPLPAAARQRSRDSLSLPAHKTKIVATIGPASESPEMLERLLRAGLNIARLNFSHGDFTGHAERIARIRAAARAVGRRVAIMADLPGPKMRVGKIDPEPIELRPGDAFTLTSEDVVGTQQRVSMSFARLPQVVKPGDRLFLNDGLIQLLVERVVGNDVVCQVVVGGELRSRKGLNLPGIDLGIRAFTDHDRACLEFALQQGVDAVSQSFVETAADIEAVRSAAAALGKRPLVIAKIERAGALQHFDEILAVADGIMVARGDLGVEVPIQEIALTQKLLIAKANLAGKPVITATQMLESMVSSRLPTRAEATDVANAILDGTDCIMLSGESAMGKYPEEAVAMLAKIAIATEPRRPLARLQELHQICHQQKLSSAAEGIALVVEHALETVPCAAVLVPTRTGATARMISRFKPTVWVVAASRDAAVCQGLSFSYGVHAIDLVDDPDNWRDFAKDWLRAHQVPGAIAMLVAGPSLRNPEANHRVEFMIVGEPAT
jgi:pyruvate kinase